MLSDRTYLLFKPRQNLPNDRLNIRQDNSYTTTTTNSSNYRPNSLAHSSSYERLSYKSYSPNSSYSTPLPKRKYAGSSSINSNIYDNNYDFNSYLNDYTPRRRTATFGSGSQNNFYSNRKPLQRSDSFGSTIGLYEKSGNMEKREMLMSSFNRHTNSGNSSNWFNRLKLNNLFNSTNTTKSILPPRPSSNFYNNYSKSNYSTYKSNPYRVNYLNYDDYFRPKIRSRPLFSDIRKSIMHKSGINPTKNNRFNYANNYNKFNKNSGQNFKNSSVLSNGSSGGLSRSSSSSGDGSISYTQQSTTATTSPSETPILQSQKSIRKVDRYRSVIKFAEHNIGKTYADRKNQINWEIDADDPFGNNDLILNKLVDHNLVNDKIKNQISYDNNVNELNSLNKEIENIWNVITDTTILTHSSSTNTVSDLNVGYEQCTDNEIANKLEQQFADIKRKNEELEKLKIAFENDNQLNMGKRKLHKSVNLKTTDDKLNLLNKKSKSVKINANVMIKDIKSIDFAEQINKVNENFNKLDSKQDNKVLVNGELIDETQDKNLDKTQDTNQDKTKKILKTSNSLIKKSSKVKIKENDLQKESINKDNNNNNLNNDKFKNKQQTFKTLFVKPETYIVNCNQGYRKTEYSKPEIYSTSICSSFIKTIYQSPKLEIAEKKTKLIKTDYKRLELEIISKLSPLIKTDYERPKIYSTIIILPLIKTDYERPKIYSTTIVLSPIKTDYQSPKLLIIKLNSPLIKSDYHKPIIEIVELKSDPIKTDYFKLKLFKTKSTRLPHPKTSYYQPEIMIVESISPLHKTDYHKFRLEEIIIKLPMFKTNYEHLEWHITKPIMSSLIKTDYQSPKLMIIKLNSPLIKSDYQSPKLVITKLNTELVKTDYISLPIQITIKEQEHSKTEYFKYPIQITQLQLANNRTEYFKVPVQEVNLKINFINCLDYQYPIIELKHQTSTGKPPLNPSVNQLNRSSRKSTLNNQSSKVEKSIDTAIKNTLSSIKSVLSLSNNSNDLKRSDDDDGKKKVKKVKKVKVKKSSSVSGSTSNETNENRLTNIIVKSKCSTDDIDDNDDNLNNNYLKVDDKKPLLTRSISLDQNDNYQSNSNFENTFHNATTSKEQYKLPFKRRIVFRKYNINDFYLQSVLGRGSFGKVFLAELVGHDVYFAIKCLKKNVVIEDNDVESTMIERKVLALGSTNPFICKLFCTFQTDSYLCFAMEYLAGGDLMFHVQKQGRFDEARARFYSAEIVCALKFLHRRYIIYRDLKLDNVLLDQQGHIRLVDFGMCQCKIYRQECLPSNFCGTPDYMAPEIIKGVKYNNAVDWWSFGVLLYEMLIGKSPFTGADEDELLWNVCNEKIIFPLFLSKEAVHIIALLLNRNPDKRLGCPGCPAGDITQQQFFDIINWQMADAKLLPPPFIPDLNAANDISNFDKEFTEAEPALTPVDSSIINELNHELFDGFDYTNPNMTD